ncbi:hypothetical protein GHT06_017281 [Daphnia sinensis]|uniref:Uncharacterized protein n=1 Tax=Daphnia sinensis TaxID=1820382 RepID=A0AAD5L839_9CRUS|nr:hypothetical protein GHT06_017281 [Daphnia sinensis]
MEVVAEIAVPFDGQVGCPEKLDQREREEKPVTHFLFKYCRSKCACNASGLLTSQLTISMH